MAALSRQTLRSGTEWFAVDDVTASGSARRAAMRLAERLGFDESRIGDVGIVVTEVVANLYRHADDAMIALQVGLREGVPGVQVVAIDHGPGMTDFSALSTDGRSTAGTLGVGLGAVARLATSLDVSSQPGLGTVLVAGIWTDAPTADRDVELGGVTRAIASEEVCGDALAGRETDQYQVVIVADGLGHGPLAAVSSQAAVAAFFESDEIDPQRLLGELHDRLGHTRGAAVAVVSIDPAFRRLRMAGIGNISTFIVRGDARRSVVSYPGIVGHRAVTIRQLDFDIDDDCTLVMHSDGVKERWDLAATPGLARRSATVIAASLLRDAGGRRDDASVLVARRAR
jgi:anti-sigma regulatory factor (Ser/Thr protein kinase)